MAKQGMFGKFIPRPRDIVKIDGNDVVDKDGDTFSRDLVRINKALGGGFELAEFPKKRKQSQSRDK